MKNFWVHVREDGTERVFETPPSDLPTLTIWTHGVWEFTKTYDITFADNPTRPVAVVPKGAGWMPFADHSDEIVGSSMWRRKRRRG